MEGGDTAPAIFAGSSLDYNKLRNGLKRFLPEEDHALEAFMSRSRFGFKSGERGGNRMALTPELHSRKSIAKHCCMIDLAETKRPRKKDLSAPWL